MGIMEGASPRIPTSIYGAAMLTSEQLISLYRDLRSTPVLSVYVNADQHDPANRTAWRVHLDNHVREVRASLDGNENRSPRDFDRALAHINDALQRHDGFLPGRGWVGFATADGPVVMESVPVPMPTLVRWEDGLRVAPYLRGLKQARPVVVAIVDSRRARLYVYSAGELEAPLEIAADRDVGEVWESSSSKRASTHSGKRGETARDAGQAVQRAHLDRMLDECTRRVVELAGSEGFVVLGGVHEPAAALSRRLPDALGERCVEWPALHLDMSPPQIKAEVEEAASELSRALQDKRAREVVDIASAGGDACLGWDETVRAVRERRARRVYVSAQARESRPDDVDHLVGTAFEGGAEASELAGAGGELLDREAGGVAALLRYRVDAPETAAG